MSRIDEVRVLLRDLNNEYRSLQLEEEEKSNHLIVGKCYKSWEDTSRSYMEYLHIVRIDEYHNLKCEWYKVYDNGGVEFSDIDSLVSITNYHINEMDDEISLEEYNKKRKSIMLKLRKGFLNDLS